MAIKRTPRATAPAARPPEAPAAPTFIEPPSPAEEVKVELEEIKVEAEAEPTVAVEEEAPLAPVTSKVAELEEVKEELPAPPPPPVVKSGDPLEGTGFVRCRALRTVAARGMPHYTGEIFTHFEEPAKEAEARGDLEILRWPTPGT